MRGCQTYGRWVEAERRLAETPALIKLQTGYVQQNPWPLARRLQQAARADAKLMSEIGLTPVSRSRVNTKPATSYPKPWEFGQSKFDGLLGGHKPDEFFDD